MPYAPVSSGQLYYEQDGEGPAIVFAHGAGGNHLSWWQQVPAFRDGYRCIVYDQRGFGQSREDPPGRGPEAFAADLLALLDHLEIERAAVVAQSMGGWSALGVALRAPERVAALVMADTLGGVVVPALEEARRAAQERIETEGVVSLAYSPRLREREPRLAFLYDEIAALNPPRPGTFLQELHSTTTAAEELKRLQPPTLWIVGSEDPLTPPSAVKEAQALAAGSQYWEAAETGHSVYFERAEQFNERLSSFLREAGWG